jgi:hypothetical protein
MEQVGTGAKTKPGASHSEAATEEAASIISCLERETFFYCGGAGELLNNKVYSRIYLCGLQNSAMQSMLVMWRGGAVNVWLRPGWRSRM